MPEIRWGIIGCGDVTEVKSGPALQKAEGSQLVAVMRRNGTLAADYARRHNVARWYDDAQQLIDDSEVNAVYVATPPSTHKQFTLMALAAGKPVYVEKPMALNYTECQEMLAAATAANLPLFVAYYRRSLARFLQVKELIDSGAIGNVHQVTSTLSQPPLNIGADGAIPWRVDPAVAGGGLFVDLASHMLDLLDYILGPIARVEGFAANQGGRYQAEDMVSSAFLFESGVQGVGSWCFNAFAHEDRTEIVGSLGKVSYATFADRPVTLTTAHGSKDFNHEHPTHIQQPLIQTVVDALRGTGACPSSGQSAARTSWVMDQMLSRYKLNVSISKGSHA